MGGYKYPYYFVTIIQKYNMERNRTSPYYIDISPCSIIINYYDYIL